MKLCCLEVVVCGDELLLQEMNKFFFIYLLNARIEKSKTSVWKPFYQQINFSSSWSIENLLTPFCFGQVSREIPRIHKGYCAKVLTKMRNAPLNIYIIPL